MMLTLVAERVFHRADNGETVIARIFAPLQTGPALWSAKLQILGMNEHVEEVSCGVDSFQALCNALRMLCFRLEKIETNLTFQGSGNVGLPVIVPWDGEPGSKAEVYQFANDKILRYLKSLPTASEEPA
jgi:hypothetical protein